MAVGLDVRDLETNYGGITLVEVVSECEILV
jgi:hypothetical protein